MVRPGKALLLAFFCAVLFLAQRSEPHHGPSSEVETDGAQSDPSLYAQREAEPDATPVEAGPSLLERERLIKRQLELLRRNGQRNREGALLYRWSETLLAAGNPAGALEKLQQAAAVLRAGGVPEVGLAKLLLTMGRLHRSHGNHRQSIRSAEEALDIFRRLGQPAGESRALQMLGIAYFKMGDRKKGLQHFEESVEAARQIAATSVKGKLHVRLAALGYAYVQLGEYERAVDLLEGLHRETLKAPPLFFYWVLSSAYFHLGRYEMAGSIASRGVDLARDRGKAEALLFSLLWRERALRELGRVEEAATDVEEALALMEGIRARLVPADLMKAGFTSQYLPLVNDAIEILHKLGRDSRAFEVAEQARARAFLDLLATRLAGSETAPDLDFDELDSLFLPGNDPLLPSTVSAAAATTAEVAARAARLDSTIVAYWFNPDAVYIWIVHPDGRIQGVRQEVSERRLTHLIQQAQSRGETARQALLELYKHLVGPVRRQLPAPGSRLTIIPHGPAFGLPFAALIGERGRYLLEDYTLHYAPAMTAFDLVGSRQSRTAGPTARYLIAANPIRPPRMPDGTLLPSLPGSRLELEKIARLLPPESTRILAGQGLRTEELLRSLADRTVIHFATHAVVDPGQPLDSFLALSYGERLTAGDIYDMSLQADLVMLSACRSASGAVSVEGVLGLTRALFYAGAESVVASVWDIADDPAAELMAEFYRQYQQTEQKDRSLQAAQLRLLNDLRSGRVQAYTPAGPVVLPEHPALWAGFVLLGDPQ